MPTYEFKCKCGLVFERRLQVGKAEEGHKCPNCGGVAPQKLSSATCTYSFKTDGTINPQCTGLSGVDLDYDRIIGEDAKEKWEIHQKREEEKREIMRKSGVDKTSISIDSDNAYVVITEEERESTRRIRGFNNLAISSLNRKDGDKILEYLKVRRRDK